MAENYYYSSIRELSKLIREQRVSPVAIVNTCLKRIEELNPKLNAFITVLADQAVERAKEIEAEIKAGNWRGPLHGIPVGVKDFFDTAGIRTTGAFEPLKNRVPTKDAEVVAISVPCGFDAHALPLGLQIVGKPWDEGAVLQLAHQYQTATEYGKKHPIP